MSETETVGLAWTVLLGFVRLSTRAVVMAPPLRPVAALDLVDEWLAQPCTTVVYPTDRHLAVLRDLVAAVGTAGNRTTDTHLGALAIEHGATLYSADVDFLTFPGVRWVNPLETS